MLRLPVSGHFSWRKLDFAITGKRRRPGGSPRCFGSGTQMFYFQNLRVERAKSLVHGSDLDLDAIAAEVGYVDGATLGALLRQRLGRGVRDLRGDLRWFPIDDFATGKPHGRVPTLSLVITFDSLTWSPRPAP